ncbi:MAG TPA: pyruvate kinase [Myxococcaceae bacterium]|nr:pyruvate kinase [Myxococcaceae bacterium]
MTRRSKIVCTLGPASDRPRVLAGMIRAGLDVARINFSHGLPEEHRARVAAVRREARRAGRNVAILQDLQGPKLRLGVFAGGRVELAPGETVLLVARPGVVGSPRLIPVPLSSLARDCHPGHPVLLDDGRVRLRVKRSRGRDVECEVEVGGPVSDHKGVSLPGSPLSIPAFTPKDRRDAALGRELGVDLVAMSFVRSGRDVERARRHIGAGTPLIAKMEKPQAIQAMEEILRAADGVMVARGDLGVELPPEEVPAIQKDIIRRSNLRGLPVIVATQMLNSMIEHPRPTRAEASDVANAVYDGADALMLSGESASGSYPVESVQMMERIILAAESAARTHGKAPARIGGVTFPASFPDVISQVACDAARTAGAVVIAAFTLSGHTARLLSHYRPAVPIVAFSPNQEVRRKLSLLWGVVPRVLEPVDRTEEMVRRVEEELLSRGFAHRGDRVVIVYGAPVGQPGKINSMRLHEIA